MIVKNLVEPRFGYDRGRDGVFIGDKHVDLAQSYCFVSAGYLITEVVQNALKDEFTVRGLLVAPESDVEQGRCKRRSGIIEWHFTCV